MCCVVCRRSPGYCGYRDILKLVLSTISQIVLEVARMRVLPALLVLVACLCTSTAKRKDAVETMEKGASFLAQAGTDGRGLNCFMMCLKWWHERWCTRTSGTVVVPRLGSSCCPGRRCYVVGIGEVLRCPRRTSRSPLTVPLPRLPSLSLSLLSSHTFDTAHHNHLPTHTAPTPHQTSKK